LYNVLRGKTLEAINNYNTTGVIMNIAILGTGTVGEVIGEKLIALGHSVKMGSRTKDNEKAISWAKKSGERASYGTFADAAAFGELIFNCTAGVASLDALSAAGEQNLGEKILLDISNPLDFSKGMPPSLSVSNTDSLGEQIQRKFPKLKVVKTLNTVNCYLMVDANRIKASHTMFVCGNDASAKANTQEILRSWFGWKDILDLGDITAARATESYLHLWLRLWGAVKTADFNISVTR
jgi:predicted dinucleotide-binding enzyme